MIHTKNKFIKIGGGIGQKANTYMYNPGEKPLTFKILWANLALVTTQKQIQASA